jgi:hypothetical protein
MDMAAGEGRRVIETGAPGSLPPTVTYHDLEKCCHREVQKRRHVYPRLIASGRMTQVKADREIEIMGAACAFFAALANEDEQKGKLL